MIALDTETELATNTQPIPRLVSAAFAGAGGVELYAAHDPRLEDRVAAAIDDGLIGAMLPFDVTVKWRAFPRLLPNLIDAYERGRVADVLTREKMIDIAETGRPAGRAYSLAAIADRYGIPMEKDDTWRLHYGELLGLEIADWPSEAVAYAQFDAWVTWEIYRLQQEREHLLVSAPEQARAHLALYAQTLRGIHTDPVWVEALDRWLGDQQAVLTQVCVDAGLARYKHKIKRPSPIVRSKKAAQAMLEELAVRDPSIRVTYTEPTETCLEGQVSLSQEALDTAGMPAGKVVFDATGEWPHEQRSVGRYQGHPLEAYRLLGSVQSRRTKNVTILRRPVIRPRYDECVDSARTSCSGPQGRKKPADLGPDEWIGTNLQNQERDDRFRGCLVAPPGHRFIVSDFGALELVTFAQVQLDMFGRSALADMLRKGRDPHREFACDLLGIREDFRKDDHKAMRTLAKAWNFGKPGAMGQARFIRWARKAYGVDVTPEQERQHTATWHRRFPEVRMFWDRVRTMEFDGLYRVTMKRTGFTRGGMRFPDACNHHFQHLGAMAAKRSLWRLFVAGLDPRSPLHGCYQVLFVHDEHVTVAPTERAEAALAEQERIMIASAAEVCPDVPIGVESTISERYEKP